MPFLGMMTSLWPRPPFGPSQFRKLTGCPFRRTEDAGSAKSRENLERFCVALAVESR